MKQYLVFDAGGTFVKYALMNEEAAIAQKGRIPAPTESLDQFLDAFRAVAAQFRGQYDSVAASVPGRVDTDTGLMVNGGAFGFIHNTPMGELLRSRLGGVPVTLANDAKCAAFAELGDGALVGVKNGCVMILGTGIGGAVVLNGQLYFGSSLSAGEFSTMPTDFEGIYRGIQPPEGGGAYSMWTGQASTTGLLHTYALRKGLPPENHGLDGVQFFEAYDRGEPAALEALAVFGRQAAAGIYTIQAVLDVERFAIGGGISARREVVEIIRASLDTLFEKLPITPFPKPEIVPCRYGNDANLIGALRFHLERGRKGKAADR